MAGQNGAVEGMSARFLVSSTLTHLTGLRVSNVVGCELPLNIEMLRFIEFLSPIPSVRVILTVTSLHTPSAPSHLVPFHCSNVEKSPLKNHLQNEQTLFTVS